MKPIKKPLKENKGEITNSHSGTRKTNDDIYNLELINTTIQLLKYTKSIPKNFRFWKIKNKELTTTGAITLMFALITITEKTLKALSQPK